MMMMTMCGQMGVTKAQIHIFVNGISADFRLKVGYRPV